MKTEEKINDEIKKFLQYTTNNPKEEENTVFKNNIEQLTFLVKELNRLYENTHPKETDTQVFCNKIVTLIKSIIGERKDREMEINENQKKISKLENQIVLLEDKRKKEQDNTKYKNMDIKELERIIKDLNCKVKGYKTKNENLRKSMDSVKSINDDLVNVRESLMRKNHNLEEQIGLFDVYLREKEEENKGLKDQKKTYETEVNKYKTEVKQMIDINEKLKEKLEDKDKSLSILNDELANLLGKDKAREDENRNMREKTEYYERLYKSVAKQNEYLNEQLSKMINVKNIDMVKNMKKSPEEETKNEDEYFDVMTKEDIANKIDKLTINNQDSDLNASKCKSIDTSKYRKYKKKLLAQKKDNERLKKEIDDQNEKINNLQDKIEKLCYENEKANINYKKLTNNLFERIEKLMKQNKTYHDNIFDLKSERRRSVKNPNDKKVSNFAPKFIEHINSNRDDSFKTVIGNEYDNHKYGVEEPNTKKYEHMSVADRYDNDKNLNFDFYADDKGEGEVYGKYDKKHVHKDISSKVSKSTYDNDLSNDSSDYVKELRQMNNFVNSDDFPKFFEPKKENNEIITNEKFENIFEDTKSELIKKRETKEDDISTTSSLKNMIEKTDKLKERFSNLENQLEKIKEGDDNLREMNLVPKLAYNDFYLSDAYDFKNDPDAL